MPIRHPSNMASSPAKVREGLRAGDLKLEVTSTHTVLKATGLDEVIQRMRADREEGQGLCLEALRQIEIGKVRKK